MDSCHYVFVGSAERTTARVNPDVNCGLRVRIVSQRRFIVCNKCPTLVRGFRNGGGCVWRQEVGPLWEISVPPAWFCCERKIALKNEVY